MGAIGIPELMIVLVIFATSIIPIAVAVWAIVTLYRMRGDQQAMRRSLESIEQQLRSR
jgi:sensor domain CHASE-containing protein